MITKVNNPGKKASKLIITLNQQATDAPATIAPGQTIEVRSPLPANSTNVSVHYTGNKTLVLLETRFE